MECGHSNIVCSGLSSSEVSSVDSVQTATDEREDSFFDPPMHPLSIMDWSHWCISLAKTFRGFRLSVSEENKVQQIFRDTIIKENPQCPAGPLVNVMWSVGLLRFRDSSTLDWIFKNAHENILKFTMEELDDFVYGAHKIDCRERLKTLLDKFSQACQSGSEKEKEVRRELSLRGIAGLLKVASRAHVTGPLRDLLLELADEKWDQFTADDKIELIAGLEPKQFKNSNKALDLLKKIEKDLTSTGFILTSDLKLSLKHFDLCRYVPLKLIPQVEEKLKAPLCDVSIYDKFTLLSITAMLGIDSFADYFKNLLPHLYVYSHRYQCYFYELMDLKELAYVFYTAAFYLNPGEQKLMIKTEMIDYVCKNSFKLEPKEQTVLASAIRAIGSYEGREWIGNEGIKKGDFYKYSQNIINEAIKKWFYDKGLGSLNIQPGEIWGRPVDLKIEGFSRLGIRGQRILVIEINDAGMYSSNVDRHPLGKHRIRQRIMISANIDLIAYRYRHSPEETIQGVLKILEKKWNTHWKRYL